MDNIFDRIFLSCEMNLRKPDKEIFRRVLREAAIRPEDTLFVDDNASNVAAAQELGIRTFHETDGHRWVDLIRTVLS